MSTLSENTLSPVKVVTSTSFKEDISAIEFNTILTIKATLTFWNVGSKVSGYGNASMDVTTISSVDGSTDKMQYKGTFSGGRNGVIKLSDGETNLSLKVMNGKRIKVEEEDIYFEISDASVFNF